MDPVFFFFNATAPTEIYTLSLHDALPISYQPGAAICREGEEGSEMYIIQKGKVRVSKRFAGKTHVVSVLEKGDFFGDRKSTRLNSSHVEISYAVFCLKKKIKRIPNTQRCQ